MINKHLWVTCLFYVPMITTYIHPLLGVGVTSALLAWHYTYPPFKHEMNKLQSVRSLDPREPIVAFKYEY